MRAHHERLRPVAQCSRPISRDNERAIGKRRSPSRKNRRNGWRCAVEKRHASPVGWVVLRFDPALRNSWATFTHSAVESSCISHTRHSVFSRAGINASAGSARRSRPAPRAPGRALPITPRAAFAALFGLAISESCRILPVDAGGTGVRRLCSGWVSSEIPRDDVLHLVACTAGYYDLIWLVQPRATFPEKWRTCDKSYQALRVRRFVWRPDRDGPRVRAHLDGSGADGCRRQDISRLRQ